MGSRSNVVVKEGSSQVWFYGHWNGDRYVADARKALARRVRWDDGPYLARIVFDGLVAVDPGRETGFGITDSITDNEHPILVLDVNSQRVSFVQESELKDRRLPEGYRAEGPTFAEFVDGQAPDFAVEE